MRTKGTLKEKMMCFVLSRPFLVDTIKSIFSCPAVANSTVYKMYTLRAAKRYAARFPQGDTQVSIETTLNCNARCLMCYHHVRQMQGTMRMDLFKKIVDDCRAHGITGVGLAVYGEPMMDPHLFERIQYLRTLNMQYGLFTNGYLLDKDRADKLFALGGLNRINFSVCGYSPEIYERVMVGLKRDTTYRNIMYFLSLKEKYKRQLPAVVVSSVKLNLNKKETKTFVKFWRRQRGVDMVIMGDLWARAGDKEVREIGEVGKMHNKNNWLPPCRQLWGSLYVYYDGRVASCCDDNDKRELIVGDMNTQSLRQILTGERLLSLRALHLDDKRRSHPICGRCYHNCVWC